MNELQALTQSIGEQTILYLGKDQVSALEVLLDTRIMEARVSVSLKDNSEESQLRAFGLFGEIEGIFSGEVSIAFGLEPSEWEPQDDTAASTPSFVYA